LDVGILPKKMGWTGFSGKEDRESKRKGFLKK
jgi:hypothetical protein